MNTIEVLGGGFPGTSKTWRFIRDMIKEVHEAATALGGDNCIVKGCEIENGQANEGIIILNGEALPFIGGAVQSSVIVVEAKEQVQYFNDSENSGQADIRDAYFTRYAKFSDNGFSWSDLNRISPLKEISKRLPPVQSALPFWGSVNSIKEGWQLCDGSNGTPDLRGMFIAGYDPNDEAHNTIGKTGGESKVTLTEAQLPAHKHSGSVYIKGHRHSLPKQVPSPDGGIGDGNLFSNKDNSSNTFVSQTDYEPGHSATLTTQNTGEGQSHENRPKFYTMAWIAYVG
ncbi:MAG: hypothetical protein CMP12_05890 [Zunongwangia sp.]|uniref:phage baseplate protein n=1 Tax=Zunongwangia profunda TaxID=398743 RepID=UPI000C97B35F|nr:hypothetical protein [Zunongwangia profunda]MAO35434.1 hypothetical protein [Zunongwangia sp.]|tara:strand:+ start:1488 stop:2342 length:855 start_codon:yes stop_codon:yes gene_type:complete